MKLILVMVLVTAALIIGLLTGYPILIGGGAVLAVLVVVLVQRL